MVYGNAATHGWQVGQGDVACRPHLALEEPVLCATSFHPYGAFPSFDVPRTSTKLMELVSNKHLSSIS
jgi:hypothetical protein